MSIREYVEQRALAIRYLSLLWIVAILIGVFAFPERFAKAFHDLQTDPY